MHSHGVLTLSPIPQSDLSWAQSWLAVSPSGWPTGTPKAAALQLSSSLPLLKACCYSLPWRCASLQRPPPESKAHLQQCSRVPLLTANQSSALTVFEHIPSSHPVPRSPRGPPYYLNSLLTGLSSSSSSSIVERVILKQHRVMQLSSSKTVMHSPFHIGSSSSSLLLMWRCVFLVASHPPFILQISALLLVPQRCLSWGTVGSWQLQ